MIEERQPAPGDARCPGPSTTDLYRLDRTGAPEPLLAESYAFQGDDDLSFTDYTSRTYLQLEYERLWSRVWQWACREEHIPNVGDYHVYDIGDRSVIVTRTNEGIKAYNNFCLHRGTQLRPSGSTGATKQFRCPFHGWTWSIDGTLTEFNVMCVVIGLVISLWWVFRQPWKRPPRRRVSLSAAAVPCICAATPFLTGLSAATAAAV